MHFEIYKSEPYTIPIQKSRTDGHPLKSASLMKFLTRRSARLAGRQNLKFIQKSTLNDKVALIVSSEVVQPTSDISLFIAFGNPVDVPKQMNRSNVLMRKIGGKTIGVDLRRFEDLLAWLL